MSVLFLHSWAVLGLAGEIHVAVITPTASSQRTTVKDSEKPLPGGTSPRPWPRLDPTRPNGGLSARSRMRSPASPLPFKGSGADKAAAAGCGNTDSSLQAATRRVPGRAPCAPAGPGRPSPRRATHRLHSGPREPREAAARCPGPEAGRGPRGVSSAAAAGSLRLREVAWDPTRAGKLRPRAPRAPTRRRRRRPGGRGRGGEASPRLRPSRLRPSRPSEPAPAALPPPLGSSSGSAPSWLQASFSPRLPRAPSRRLSLQLLLLAFVIPWPPSPHSRQLFPLFLGPATGPGPLSRLRRPGAPVWLSQDGRAGRLPPRTLDQTRTQGPRCPRRRVIHVSPDRSG
nr:uncharacterized protein LOC101787269 [Cavia porcellus]